GVALGWLPASGMVRTGDRRLPARAAGAGGARRESPRSRTVHQAPVARLRLARGGSSPTAAAGRGGGGRGAPLVDTALIFSPSTVSFRSVAGLPLIQRTVLSAVRSGFDRIVVMRGTAGPRLQQLLAHDPRTRHVELIDEAPARVIREGRVAIIPSDCLVTPATLTRLRDAPSGTRPTIFGADGGTPRMILCEAANPGELAGALAARDGYLRALDGAEAATLRDELCVRVTDDHSARVAETRLLAQLRAATADSDGPIARLDRSASQWISRRLVH